MKIVSLFEDLCKNYIHRVFGKYNSKGSYTRTYYFGPKERGLTGKFLFLQDDSDRCFLRTCDEVINTNLTRLPMSFTEHTSYTQPAACLALSRRVVIG
jgi:hypothetical protein